MPGSIPIIITGGGTAGHTNPGIAVAEALVAAGVGRDEIHFIGGLRGNEGELVPAAGFSIDLLKGRGIQRKLTPANIGSILGLLAGFFKGFAIVAKRKPRAVLCLGGYAAFAASAAAVILRVPLVVTEQNARASAVNRLFGRFAKVCALPFPDTDLPNGVLTGNPIRAAIVSAVADGDTDSARAGVSDRYRASTGGDNVPDLSDRVLVAVWAGSLGATKINEGVKDLANRWADRSDIALYHVVGTRDWDRFETPPPENADGLAYLTVQYENNMPDLLLAADVAICRSGASTVTELAVAGLPAILVPLPGAPRDHQRANSAELAAAGGAIVIDNADVSGSTLAELLEPLVEDAQRRAEMAQAAASVARPAAAPDVAALLMNAGGLTEAGGPDVPPAGGKL